jgi:hypothetical protein
MSNLPERQKEESNLLLVVDDDVDVVDAIILLSLALNLFQIFECQSDKTIITTEIDS